MASSGQPFATQKVIDLTVNFIHPKGQLEHAMNEVLIEFRDTASGDLVDVGTVKFDLEMNMAGMVMHSGSDIRQTATPGQYRTKVTPDMAGGWTATLRYEGPRGKGDVSFPVNREAVSIEADTVNQPSERDVRLHELDHADMARLASGHDAALNDLMERHGSKLFHYLTHCLQNEEDAADTAQEAFVRVYQNRARFDSNQRFSTWLYAIATNLVKDRYRYRTRHPHVSVDAENEATGTGFRESLPGTRASPGETLQAEERAQIVRRAVEALPEELRVPLVLFEYEELSHAEIAAILKCSAKAVETRLYRARQELRTALGPLLEAS